MKTSAPNRNENIPESRVRTLVVDDSPFMVKILAQILEEAGNFDLVGSTSDGCQALRYVSMLSPELVLMDLHMPHLNGIQATRFIKQREPAPTIVMVTSDDSPSTRTTADNAGVDAFVAKDGNLRQQLMGALQDLFGANGTKRAKTRNTSNGSRRCPSQTSQGGPGCVPTRECFNSGSGKCDIQATDLEPSTQPSTKPFLGSAQRPQTQCPHIIRHSLRQPLGGTLVQLCASSRIQPPRKAGASTYDIMKTRKQQGNTGQGKVKMSTGVPPTNEEIRRRAHELFLARGGTPGNELDDWLRAEQELKQERAGINTNAT
jgi:CheY-like chemotaxis protein